MYIIICTIYTTVQRRQTYTITIQHVYNYMYSIYNGTVYCYCICLSSLYRCIYGTYNYIHLALLLYMFVFSVVYIVHIIIYILYCYCICLSSLYRCIYCTYNYIHFDLLLYMFVYNNNSKCI
jgi:hypothetical protein